MHFSRLLVVFWLAASCDAAGAPDPAFAYVGTYEKVESATGEHCSGYSVDLWKDSNVLFGLLHHHRGLCGDPPCGVLTDVRHDSESGRLRFNADTAETIFSFEGSLRNESLKGTLTSRWSSTDRNSKEAVQLPKQREVHAGRIGSLAEWHEVYDSIKRCRGVPTYMPSR